MSRESSLKKKDMILASARKLFYEQGYDNTFLEHIAKDCGISKQLLLYYFPSKAKLADEVLGKVAEEVKELAQKKMFDYFGGMKDLQVCTAVELKLASLLYLHDEKAMRFQKETAFLALESSASSTDMMSFYDMHVREYDLKLDEGKDELKMIADIFDVADAILLYHYSCGKYDCTEEQFLDYTIEVLDRLMKVPPERIEAVNRMSNAILGLLNFRFLPCFVIE